MVRDFLPYGIANGLAGSQTFVSDSVLIAPPFVQNGVHHYALTLGALWGGSPSTPLEAKVDVIDLKLTPPARVATFTVKDPAGQAYIYPADFHLAAGGRQLALRCDASPIDPGVVGGRDFVRFDLTSLSEMARIGASGSAQSVDSLEIARQTAISLGQNSLIPAGYVHTVLTQ